MKHGAEVDKVRVGRHNPFAKTQKRHPCRRGPRRPWRGTLCSPVHVALLKVRVRGGRHDPFAKTQKRHPCRLGPRRPWRGTLCSPVHVALLKVRVRVGRHNLFGRTQNGIPAGSARAVHSAGRFAYRFLSPFYNGDARLLRRTAAALLRRPFPVAHFRHIFAIFTHVAMMLGDFLLQRVENRVRFVR